MNNMIASGFHAYAPPKGWEEDGFVYWEKVL
jgi:hypothetical protein